MSGSLAHSAARGMMFTMGSQVVKIGFQLASVAILARLLTPHDYGLIALVLVVVGAAEIFRDFGLTPATIQAETLSTGQRDRLFWLNTAIGAVLAVIVFGASWPISWITGQPEMLQIMQVMSVLFILNGLSTQYRAGLLRSLRFKAIAIIDIAASAAGLGAAILGALAGWAYWALVAQQLVTAAATLIGGMIASRWLPGRWRDGESIRSFIRFGGNVVATNLLVYAGNQLDTVLVGMRFGTSALGLYNRAYQLVMTPLGQIRGPLNNVAQPVFARVQNDQARFDKYVIAGQLALGYGAGLPLAALIALADPVVQIMLGERWIAATPIMQLFAFAAFVTNLSMVGYWVYVSRGLVNRLFRFTFISLAIRIACIVTGSMFGVIGVAVGFALAPTLAWPLSLWWLSRATPVPVRALYAGAARIIVLGAAICGGAWLSARFVPGGPVVEIVAGLLGAAVVGAAALLIGVYRRDAQTLTWFLKLMLKREKK